MNSSFAMTNPIIKKFVVQKEMLRDVALSFGGLMGAGLDFDYALNPAGPDGKTEEFRKPLLMLPSHVKRIPTGEETGSFLAIDLGGSNIRVCAITLMKDGNPVAQTTDEEIAEIEARAAAELRSGKPASHSIMNYARHRCVQAHYRIPEALKTSKLEDLMKFIAECIFVFLCEYNTATRVLFPEKSKNVELLIPENYKNCKSPDEFFFGPIPKSLGFTFSFPVRQISLVKSKLITWTKGFSIADGIGKDVGEALQNELQKLSLDVKVAALINDTVGTLLAHAYEQPETNVAVILGTGTNAAYIEECSNIKKLGCAAAKDDEATSKGKMIINIEWGAYHAAREILPQTRADQLVDEHSLNPRKQLLEKMISGMYLGEIARHTIIELIECDATNLFGGKSSAQGKAALEALKVANVIGTDALQWIDDAPSGSMTTRAIECFEKRVGLKIADDKDCRIVCDVISVVRQRAARLSAAAIYAVLRKMKKPDVRLSQKAVVAIDGTLFLKYEKFRESLNHALAELFTAEEFKLVHLSGARDGSGMGAAIVAAVYSH